MSRFYLDANDTSYSVFPFAIYEQINRLFHRKVVQALTLEEGKKLLEQYAQLPIKG